MALSSFTATDRTNIKDIMNFITELPEDNQKQIYYIAVGMAYGNNCLSKEVEEKEDAKSSTN